MNTHKLLPTEKRAIISISSIMGLRMIGLFMVLPVFSLYASHLRGASASLVGIALGVYGLFQAVLQAPLGALSDRLGRKPVIVAGLVFFVIGSFIASIAHSITFMIIGRALQGIGAIGGTTLAMMSDLTRESQRTKAMAIAGMTIGASFSLAMLIGPIMTPWIEVNGLFFFAALLGLVAIILLLTQVPTPADTHWHGDTEPERHAFFALLFKPKLAVLTTGIFLLHAVFTATFVVLPISLHQYLGYQTNQQWIIYLPALLVAFVLTLAGINVAEKRQQTKAYFLSSIALLLLAEGLLWQGAHHVSWILLGTCLFFIGFSMLEAFLPSMMSKTAPKAQKGSALGVFSCAQFLGIFVGGVLGGVLYGKNSFSGVYLFCVILAFFWLVLAFFLTPSKRQTTSPIPE